LVLAVQVLHHGHPKVLAVVIPFLVLLPLLAAAAAVLAAPYQVLTAVLAAAAAV
jgi:hypothetical protein